MGWRALRKAVKGSLAIATDVVAVGSSAVLGTGAALGTVGLQAAARGSEVLGLDEEAQKFEDAADVGRAVTAGYVSGGYESLQNLDMRDPNNENRLYIELLTLEDEIEDNPTPDFYSKNEARRDEIIDILSGGTGSRKDASYGAIWSDLAEPTSQAIQGSVYTSMDLYEQNTGNELMSDEDKLSFIQTIDDYDDLFIFSVFGPAASKNAFKYAFRAGLLAGQVGAILGALVLGTASKGLVSTIRTLLGLAEWIPDSEEDETDPEVTGDDEDFFMDTDPEPDLPEEVDLPEDNGAEEEEILPEEVDPWAGALDVPSRYLEMEENY